MKQPPCVRVPRQLRRTFGSAWSAALTGQDYAALKAVVHLGVVAARAPAPSEQADRLLRAGEVAASAMQAHTRHPALSVLVDARLAAHGHPPPPSTRRKQALQRPEDDAPVCVELPEFLLANYGSRVLAALESPEARLLEIVAHLAELWGRGDDDGQQAAVSAIGLVVPLVPPVHRWIAREAIAKALDWSHRATLWGLACPELVNADPRREDSGSA